MKLYKNKKVKKIDPSWFQLHYKRKREHFLSNYEMEIFLGKCGLFNPSIVLN